MLHRQSPIKQICCCLDRNLFANRTKSLPAQVRLYRATGGAASDLRELFGFRFLLRSDSQLKDDSMANEKKRSGEASGKAGDSNKRRKQNGVQKFYAVRAGKKPGVYMNYADCEAQIAGHKGAQCK